MSYFHYLAPYLICSLTKTVIKLVLKYTLQVKSIMIIIIIIGFSQNSFDRHNLNCLILEIIPTAQ